ncbi:MAG: TetR/AcrR family transcriptional regulator [Clostridiales bacterium]|nr:TetR/AcrR family transcriptional regulator [Clostridiales bacterium]
MAEKKTDRRTEKTRRALRDALADFLATKELRKITVQEIADKADVNRGTFYKHYLDVYDLYDQMENEVLIELGQIILGEDEPGGKAALRRLIDYIDDNRSVFKMIFSPYNTGCLRDKFNKIVIGLYQQVRSEKHNLDIKNKELEYMSHYHSCGCIAIIEKWVNANYVETKDFIIKTIVDLDASNDKNLKERFGKK